MNTDKSRAGREPAAARAEKETKTQGKLEGFFASPRLGDLALSFVTGWARLKNPKGISSCSPALSRRRSGYAERHVEESEAAMRLDGNSDGRQLHDGV